MKSQIMIIIFFSFILSGCNKSYHDTYIVVNNTSKQLKIEGFAIKYSMENSVKPLYNENIDIQPNSQFIILKGTGENWVPRGIFQKDVIDSVNIIFDNLRISKYKCNNSGGVSLCDDMRNIINYNEYYEKKCAKHECTYTYTITEADFDAAEIIK